MQYTKLGLSNLVVSRICLGCMGFGDPAAGQHTWTIGEDETRTIVQRALDAGINFFDTAIAYQSGTSEAYLGRALNAIAQRDDVVVATKFLPRTASEIAEGVSGQQHIINSIDASLSHLGMDYVDLYIYHMWDYNTPLKDVMEGLAQVVAAGKARYIGIANVYAWQLEKANALAEREGFPKFVSVQNHMNLIFREDERETLPCCTEEQIALTPYSALASGRLSRRLGETSKRLKEDSYAQLKYDATAEADARVIARVAEVADARGVSMTEIALAWLLAKVAAPIVGATKLHHVDGAVSAVDINLSKEEVSYLEELYVPHALVGVMAQNKPADSGKEHVWFSNAKYLQNEDKN
ncbi:aldo/keto reductase [Collinsella sp. zg1085]|nr:aldo/keto reductase [Collinsella sp. zg1085]